MINYLQIINISGLIIGLNFAQPTKINKYILSTNKTKNYSTKIIFNGFVNR